LYEVRNTFGERHCYLIPVDPVAEAPIEQTCGKRFHVSPFMEMALDYDFRVEPPAETVAVTVNARDQAGPVLATSFRGSRRPLSDAALARVLLTHPLLTIKVTAAIHLEAVKLWWKGAKFHRKPEPPEQATTVAAASAVRRRNAPPPAMQGLSD
ncbi:MAG: DUF1365 domain-containing protein, partial [Hansschlegelia sp.]